MDSRENLEKNSLSTTIIIEAYQSNEVKFDDTEVDQSKLLLKNLTVKNISKHLSMLQFHHNTVHSREFLVDTKYNQSFFINTHRNMSRVS